MAAPLLGAGLRVRIGNWLPIVEGLLTPRRLLAAFAVLVVLFSSLPISHSLRPNGHPKDYPLWYETGQKVIRGEQLYPPGEVFPFMYPPIAAVLLAPLSALGPVAMVVALTAINSLVWLGCAFLSAYLLTGRALGRHPLLYLVPVCCSAPFAFDTYHLGQVNLLLLFVMLGAFACLRAGREWGAGALVALAVGIKAFPLMAAGYLVYRRHWVACASLVVSLGVLFVAVPFAVRGPNQGAEDLKVWAGGMLFKYDNGSIGQRTGRAYSWKNQSLVGMANRLLQHKSADEDTTRNFYVNVADLDFRATTAVIVGVALAICLFYIGVMPRHAHRTPESNAIEFGMLLLMILLFSPYSFGYFFVWLLYPFAVLVHRWQKAPPGSADRRRLATVFAVCVALPALTLVHQRTAEAYGNFFFTTLILLGTLGWQLNKLKHAARAV
ncbi:hypothetical protein : Uncharacterized protein OS=Isosphaera pallida (strain ATCC 43644 / DSM 9630 / IS1B) GN=Isop_2848 PE=4 SV=1: DUF2029 [Gemmataceae bacterium]|nr:hypothetical protein : Uncharacterized protein OS=Isosphaera pallida (strain ATCC 43644 / DSM 9630 / IS1B) GN=Isop_2848 PE=4 SV=1: DUF2029 [Gemmataceae bacterium]VTT99986.1 hypothetical protein : Uncharacterized protein OS=Isosphaera pallida (strain ATCC 43644 / DSM 9630 / IS1B) GN=Isop_2848 PE=4 SV=1: DUF2029 [Gemmataceae bacterium]